MSDREEILQQINVIFRKGLNKPELEMNEATSADHVPEWDSLNHALLMVRVQGHFQVKFSIAELVQLKTIGDLCDLVEAKMKRS